MKMAVFWVVAPCTLVKFTDVSEACTASIIRAMGHESTQKTAVLMSSCPCVSSHKLISVRDFILLLCKDV
jgi:hypothetical protein